MRLTLSSVFVMALLCPLAEAASAPTWVEVRSPHFVVLTDSNEKQARKIAGQFERMRSLFQTVLPNTGGDASLPITVFACRDRRSFEPLLPSQYLQKGSLKLAGLFLNTPDRNYILLRLDDESEHPFSVVYHEYTHFVMRKAKWMPVWLGEGLAQFYENTDIQEKDVLLGRPNGNLILYLREQRIIPLATLFAVGHDSPYYHEQDKGSVFYAESWALTHFIEISDFQQKTTRLQDYAHLLANGTEPMQAARQAFGELPVLQKSLEGYIANANYQEFRLKTTFTADEASFKLVPVSANDVTAARADMMAGGGRMEEAKTLLNGVLAAEPKNTMALEAMGAIAMRNGDRVEAVRYFGQAVAGGSDSLMANYNFAASVLMTNDVSKFAQADAGLRKAIQLDPTFGPAYDALCHSLAHRNMELDEARMLCLKAVQREPDNVRYRIDAAYVAIQQQNYDNALAILRSAMGIAKTLEETDMVKRNLESVEYMKERTNRKPGEARILRRDTGSATGDGQPLTDISSGAITVEANGDTNRKTPHYAAPSAGAQKRTVHGTIGSTTCSYPVVLTLTVEERGKITMLYTNDYYKLPFTTSGFLLKTALNPCGGLEGMKANISYLPVTDNAVTGQMVSVELTK